MGKKPETISTAFDENYFAKKPLPSQSLLVGKVVVKNKILLFYYFPDIITVSAVMMDRTAIGVGQNHLPVWIGRTKIKPLKISRSKDIIRFYFYKGKNIASVQFSLEAILTELERRNQIKGKEPVEKKIILERATENPILCASSENRWESSAVFNTGAIYLNNKVHFIYRAIGESGLSVFGYASSSDGVHIDERSTIPAFVSESLLPEQEAGFTPYPYTSGSSWWGSEDPRLSVLGDTIFMTYTAFDGIHPPCVALTSISVQDFLNKQWNWEKPTIISEPGKTNKNWVVFPEKIDGKYLILHSITPEIAIEYRKTMDFENGEFISSFHNQVKRDNYWDNWIRGVGAPPIKTENGWLLLYHAMDKNDPDKYKLGAMLLDKKNPTKILSRCTSSLLEPNEWYENNGHKRGVIYNCGAVVMGNKLIVYYGGSDTFICAASVDISRLISQLTNSRTSKMELSAFAN